MYGRGSRVQGSVVRTRDRVAGAGYACNARPDLHTVCRSFPKISSALSAKVCGGSRSAKILIQALSNRRTGVARDGGLVHVSGRVKVARSTPGAHTAAPRFQSPVTRLKRKERRTGFRQSGCDRSTTPGAHAAAVTSAISAILRQHCWTGATVSGCDRSTILAGARCGGSTGIGRCRESVPRVKRKKRRRRRKALRDRRLNDLRLCCPSDPFNRHRRVCHLPPADCDSCSKG